MDSTHFGGIVMICTGIGMSMIAGLWVLLAYRKHGPAIWHMPATVTLFIVGWVISLAMTIAGIVLVTRPETHGKHARIEALRRS